MERMAAYEKQIKAAQEDWEDFTTGKRRKKFNTSEATQHRNTEAKDIGLIETTDENGKTLCRGPSNLYVPAWERNFKKSLQ